MRRGAGDGEDGGGRGGQGEVAGGRRAGTCRGTLESMLARCPPRGPEEPPTGAGAPKRTPRGRGGPTTEHTEHTTAHTEHTSAGPTSVVATLTGTATEHTKHTENTSPEHSPSIPRAYREHTASIPPPSISISRALTFRAAFAVACRANHSSARRRYGYKHTHNGVRNSLLGPLRKIVPPPPSPSFEAREG